MDKFLFVCKPANLIIAFEPHIFSRPRVCISLLPSIHSCRVNIHHCLTTLQQQRSAYHKYLWIGSNLNKLISVSFSLYTEVMTWIGQINRTISHCDRNTNRIAKLRKHCSRITTNYSYNAYSWIPRNYITNINVTKSRIILRYSIYAHRLDSWWQHPPDIRY